MEKLVKMENDLFYMLRHLKTFKDITGNNNGGIWCIRWNDGEDPMIYNDKDETIKFYVPDIQLAEYIASLHNYNNELVKEIESKYQLKG
jgi:hypothetical protein